MGRTFTLEQFSQLPVCAGAVMGAGNTRGTGWLLVPVLCGGSVQLTDQGWVPEPLPALYPHTVLMTMKI